MTCDSGSDVVVLHLGRCSCVLPPSVWFNFRCPDQGKHIPTIIHPDPSHNWHLDQCQESWYGWARSATSWISNAHLCNISIENLDAIFRVKKSIVYMSALDFRGHEDYGLCTFEDDIFTRSLDIDQTIRGHSCSSVISVIFKKMYIIFL